MSGFTDIHSHFIYGLDDGAQSPEVMQAMLTEAHKNNVSRLIATPHVTPGMEPFDYETFEYRLEEARDYCTYKGYDIEIFPGAENLYTPALPGFAERHELVTLAKSNYILVEFIPDAELDEIRFAVDFLSSRGYIPVIAHVERYKNLPYREAAKLRDEYEIIFQMNCHTVMDDKGFFQRRNIQKFLKSGLISCIASDAHDCEVRRFNNRAAYEFLRREYGVSFANRLTCRTREKAPREFSFN